MAASHPGALNLAYEYSGKFPLNDKIFDILRDFLEPKNAPATTKSAMRALHSVFPTADPCPTEIDAFGSIA